MNNKILVIATGVVLVAAFVIGTMLYQSSQAEQREAELQGKSSHFIKPNSPSMGPEDARVTLVEFLDPACAACASFHPLVKDLMKKHEGDIRLVVRFAPFHTNVEHVVMMLAAAKEQGKFWEALEVTLQNQDYWVKNHVADPQLAWELIGALGVEEPGDKSALEQFVAQENADLEALGVTKVPTFFVNEKPLPKFGAQELIGLIESELK